ncbi:hypothetical protein [Micromonospora nigra]|uniref:hypothetical protein n=1 Tax=Micromonospora nigra TaxID=145857 RepID=UPI000B85328B|nr:hypothetical protein [Micromonospora nigra]
MPLGPRRWERWNPAETRRRLVLPDGSAVEAFAEVTNIDGGTVEFTHHYRFDHGEELVSSASLRFRTEAELRDSLRTAGFTVEQVFGGWRGEPAGGGDGEFVVLARRE